MPHDRDVPHRVWWWIEDPNDPYLVPYQATYDNADEADESAKRFVRERDDPYNRLRWIKVFRAGNETYETYRWENPDPVIPYKPFKFLEEEEPKRSWFKRLFRR